MKYKLRISKHAARDIEHVLSYTLEQFGERQHEKYKQLIREAIKELAANPISLRSRERNDIHPGARILHISQRTKRARHVFLYRISQDHHVEIARFLYESMDIARHWPEDFNKDES